MADFLIYWKGFWNDIQDGNSDFDEKWHTEQKHFYKKVQSGDILWLIVFGGNLHSDEWRLISQICVEKKDINSEKEKPYGIFGNKEKSQKFNVEYQSDFTPILHKLEFESGKKITKEGRIIGQNIQQIRDLTETDSLLLKDYSASLK